MSAGLDDRAEAPQVSAVSPADRAARSGALFVERPDLVTLVVSGSERLSWLQGLVTCDVAALSRGEARWGLVLTKPGKILADVVVLSSGDEILMAVPGVAAASLAESLSHFLIMEDAEIALSTEWSWTQLHGPNGATVGRELAGGAGGHAGALDVTGFGGAIVAVPRAMAPALRAAALGDPRVVAATEADWQRLRVERLVPLHGVDMGPEQNPHEASLDRRAVSWTKGCYLGQEAVCMQDMRGRVKRRLAVLSLSGGPPPAPGAAVTDAAGLKVGDTRSASTSEVLGGAAVIALISADHAQGGTPLFVEGAPATVVSLEWPAP